MMNKTTKPSIFQYQDPIKYLNEVVAYLKANQRSFSFRFFAKKAGFSSQSTLQFILNGRRSITNKSIEKLSKGFSLGPLEFEYFQSLVHFVQEQDSRKKKVHFDQCMKVLKKKSVKTVSADQYEYFSQWYHPVVRELVQMFPDKISVNYLTHTLFPKITKKQAKDSLALLERLQLIQKDKDGNYEISLSSVATPAQLQSVVVRNFHETMGKLANESLHTVDPDRRNISATVFAMPENQLPEVKKKIQEFQRELATSLEALDKSTEDVYYLNIQLFPLTKKE